jgi:hypothetical protein
MRIACVFFGIGFLLIHAVSAGEPPVPMATEARIRAATHIFAAKGIKVRIVDEHGKPRGEHPPELVAGRGEAFELTLTEITPLFPMGWHPSKSIVVYFHDGGFITQATPRPVLGKDQIYFVREVPKRKRMEDFCINSTEGTEHLGDVQMQIQEVKGRP